MRGVDLDYFGSLPCNHERLIRLLIDSCATDRTRNADYPDLGTVLVEAVETLNDAPVPGMVANPTTGETFDTLTTGDVLVNTLIFASYQTANLPLLPYAIAEAASGNVNAVNALRVVGLSLLDSLSYGMHHSVQ